MPTNASLMTDRWRIPVCAPPAPHSRHPRLFPLRLAELRRRLTDADYAPLWRAVEDRAAAAARDGSPVAPLDESWRAAGAQALAFVGLLRDDHDLARLAKARLAAAGSGAWPSWVGMAQTMHDYLLAADLLRAAGLMTGDDEERLRDAVAPKLLEGMATAADLPQNNWRIEADCAVASAALYFWHRPGTLDMPELLAAALDGLSRMLHGLLAADGANAEGINYSRRGALPVIRLCWAYRRMTGVDLFAQPVLRRWWQWQVDMKRPDGQMFPIDDGSADFEGFPHALLVHPSLPDAPLHRWAWDRGVSIWPDWATETLLVFDNRVAPRRPQWPLNRVRTESGTALFRSGWNRDATMGILVARPFWPFGADQINTAHRHDDPTHFLLHAGGQLLVTEGGYGRGYGDEQRYSYFLDAAAHNMILVDGDGPLRVTSHANDSRHGNTSQSAGRVTELIRSRTLFGALAETSYRDADLRRSVFLVRNHWFLIVDEVESARTRRFDWILHGNGTTVETCHPDGCVWTVGDQRLWLFNLLPSGMPWRHEAARDTPARGGKHTKEDSHHTARRVWTAGRRVLFVSVLVPGAAEAPAPRVRLVGQTPVAVSVQTADRGRPDVVVWDPAQGRGGVTLSG